MTENMTDRDYCVVLATCDTLIDHLSDRINGQVNRTPPEDVGSFVGMKINQQVSIDVLNSVKRDIESLRTATSENRAKLANSLPV